MNVKPESLEKIRRRLEEAFGESEIGNRKYFDYSETAQKHLLRIERLWARQNT